MPHPTRTFLALALASAVYGAFLATGAAQAQPARARVHHHGRHASAGARNAGLPVTLGEPAGRGRAHTPGDLSGFPGNNEFNPTAPFGGQAAVTAQPGTDAYKEQMNQRRYFCKWSSNRC